MQYFETFGEREMDGGERCAITTIPELLCFFF